jgi:hypothetical protein
MLRLKKCAPRAGEARPHFLRFLPGIWLPDTPTAVPKANQVGTSDKEKP